MQHFLYKFFCNFYFVHNCSFVTIYPEIHVLNYALCGLTSGAQTTSALAVKARPVCIPVSVLLVLSFTVFAVHACYNQRGFFVRLISLFVMMILFTQCAVFCGKPRCVVFNNAYAICCRRQLQHYIDGVLMCVLSMDCFFGSTGCAPAAKSL